MQTPREFCPLSLMDKIQDSGSCDRRSIRLGGTKKTGQPCLFRLYGGYDPPTPPRRVSPPFSRRIAHFSSFRRVFGAFSRRTGRFSSFRRVLPPFSRRFAEGVRCICGRCDFRAHTFRAGYGLGISVGALPAEGVTHKSTPSAKQANCRWILSWIPR